MVSGFRLSANVKVTGSIDFDWFCRAHDFNDSPSLNSTMVARERRNALDVDTRDNELLRELTVRCNVTHRIALPSK